MTVAVHFLKSTDQEISAICFKHDTGHDVYYYSTRDSRGGLSALVPKIKYNSVELLETHQLDWSGNYGNIVKLKFDTENWTESTYAFSVTKSDVKSYSDWLILWVNENKPYSIFEGVSRTAEDFIKDSIYFFAQKGIDILYLTPPEVKIYGLKWSSKSSVALPDVPSMLEWYNIFVDYSEQLILKDLLNYINETHTMYYHEYVSGEHKYWLLNGVKIRSIYRKVRIDNVGCSYTQKGLRESNSDIHNIVVDDVMVDNVNHKGALALTPAQNTIQACIAPSLSATTTVGGTVVGATTVDDGTSSGLILTVILIAILIIMIVVALIIVRTTGEANLIGSTQPISNEVVVLS